MVFPLKRKREAATGFALSASRRDSRAHFCAYPESNVPFSCAEKKYHRFSLLWEAGTKLFLF